MRRRRQFCCAGLLLFGLAAVTAWGEKHEKAAGPAPAIRILTVPLGYYPLSSFYLMGRTSSVTLDFIDDEHLLFTFRAPGLLKRLAECAPNDEDQVIRAMVLHLPDGAIERSADWRMHDRGRYLWQLPDGRFLVRQRDTLLATDSGLELRPYLQSATPIRLVKLSPDGGLLLVESDVEKGHGEQTANSAIDGLFGPAGPNEDVQMSILNTQTGRIVAQSRALRPVDMPLIENGFVEALAAKGEHWMVRYRPFQGEPSVIADVASSCYPDESPLNETTVGVRLCPHGGGDHVFQALSLSGKAMWTYRWDSHFIWPTIQSARNGRKIAFSTLRVSHPLGAFDPFDETELQAQRIDVLDAETGRLELTEFATPMLSGGQNYALSPDGGRFAVLRENAIEVYDLPRAPAAAVAAAQ